MNVAKIKILLVDDHDMVRETWKMILEQHDSFIIVAEGNSGAQAIELAQQHQPDIILMDINMAPVNGFEATRKIARLAPQARIIGVSINNQPTYARNMMQLGAKGFMTKNSGKEEMIKAIEIVYKGGTYICEEIRNKMRPGSESGE